MVDSLTTEDLIRRLILIKELGWVRSTKKAPKNVGELLEALLGLETNSFKDPDWGQVEIKSKRRGAKNNISLTTKVPKYHSNLSAREVTERYGYKTEKGKALQITLYTQKRNSRGWQLIVSGKYLEIDLKGVIIGVIKLDDIRKQLENKMKSLAFIIADSEQRGKWEFFHFNEAYMYTEIAVKQLKKLIESDELVFEFRMRWKEGKFKNYGEAYRISEDDLYKLYSCKTRIM